MKKCSDGRCAINTISVRHPATDRRRLSCGRAIPFRERAPRRRYASLGNRKRHSVRERYGTIATDDIDSIGDSANFGLGCGNPNAIASLEAGEIVLDLGSGGGFDCFLAADEVGEGGHVIGIDMTPEMVERARSNVDENDVTNAEFRLVRALPVANRRFLPIQFTSYRGTRSLHYLTICLNSCSTIKLLDMAIEKRVAVLFRNIN